MAVSKDTPEPQWLVQEPEGHGAPRTPGRWKSMWASDCVRLEEAHKRGDAECLVYGRKYVVDMKERTVRTLYWKDELESRKVIRATYFIRKAGGWLPYTEEDAELLEDFYGSAKVQLRGESCEETEIPLTGGEDKVVMKKVVATAESVDDRLKDFEVEFSQRPVKAPSILATTFTKTTYEVKRGTPEPGGWGGVSSNEGDLPLEGEPPKHVVFVIHGIGESLWSRTSSSMSSLRTCCVGMRNISVELLEESQRLRQTQQNGGVASGVAEVVENHCSDTGKKAADDTVEGKRREGQERQEVLEGGGKAVAGEGKGEIGGAEGGGEGTAGYVEFLPVEWFRQVHGDGAVSDGLIRDITLNSILGFRDFANQAIMDVMYYLTPEIQALILKTVANELNRMWEAFSRFTPGFTGKVSIVGHSLGSIIIHDVLMAQPGKGKTRSARGPCGGDIPILRFEPEVLLACGSPIGAFLSLRSSTTLDKKQLFKFKTTKRFFNLFHVFDPVAYRLEPLLDRRLRDLEPENVPHRGGDRIHVTVKKFRGDVNAAIDKFSKATGAGMTVIQKSFATTLMSVTGHPDPSLVEAETSPEEVTDARANLPERIDWVLQESPLEGMHPWASAVFAHSSYFQNVDMIMFLLNALDEEPTSTAAGGEENAVSKTT